jgi:hypothetical protein
MMVGGGTPVNSDPPVFRRVEYLKNHKNHKNRTAEQQIPRRAALAEHNIITVSNMQVECEIPSGLGPGSTFNVEANGQTVAVTVPPGMKAGQTIRVALPDTQPAVVMATVVQPQAVQAQVGPSYGQPGYTAPGFEANPAGPYAPNPQQQQQQQQPLSQNPHFGRNPVNCICHSCGQQTRTRMEHQVGCGTWFYCLGVSRSDCARDFRCMLLKLF